MTALKMIALILSLGIDTLVMSISLGVMQTKGKARIALTFAFAEAAMPLVGLLIGMGAGQVIGRWASLVGGLAVVAVAAWLIFFEGEDGEEEKLGRNLIGWALIATAFSISLDELAVGFSIGLIGVPIGWTVLFIALQAFIFTMVGLQFGLRLKNYVGEWAEKLAGIVLALLGVWIVIDALVH